MDHFQKFEALLKITKWWKLDLCDILGHADSFDIIFLIVLYLLIIGPANYADDLVSFEEWNVLSKEVGTRGTK